MAHFGIRPEGTDVDFARRDSAVGVDLRKTLSNCHIFDYSEDPQRRQRMGPGISGWSIGS